MWQNANRDAWKIRAALDAYYTPARQMCKAAQRVMESEAGDDRCGTAMEATAARHPIGTFPVESA